MVQDLQYLPVIGNNDHVTLKFWFACYTAKLDNTSTRYNFWRADIESLNSLICNEKLDEIQSLSVEDCYTHFQSTLLEFSDQCIPKSWKRCHKKNLYMITTSEAMNRGGGRGAVE